MEDQQRGENQEGRRAEIHRPDTLERVLKYILYGAWYGVMPLLFLWLILFCIYAISKTITFCQEAYHRGELTFVVMLYASAAIVGLLTFIVSSCMLFVTKMIMEGVRI